MSKERLLGDISLKKVGQKKCLKRLRYSLPFEDVPLSKTLMTSFSDLGLSDQEKSKLTQNHRQKFCTYWLIEDKEIDHSMRELIKELKKLEQESIVIKANEYGAFVCLAAIFSGKLPQGADWRFELEEFALPLFPQKLVKCKSSGSRYEIALRYSPKGLIGPFPSLKKVPKFLEPLVEPDIEEIRGNYRVA